MKTLNKFFLALAVAGLMVSCAEETAELIDYSAGKLAPSGIATGTVGDNYGLVAMIDNSTVSEDGGTAVLDKGIAFSTKSDFDLKDATTKYVSGGKDIGAYNVTLTGLVPETTYYYRAVASNNKGVSAGDVKSFKTVALDDVPRIEGALNSGFIEESWPVEIIAVPGIYYKIIEMYDTGFDVEVNVSNGNATVARQQITTELYGYGPGYVDGTGKLNGKILTLNLRFTVSAGSFGTYPEVITLP